LAAGSCRFRRALDACELILGPIKDPKHRVSMKSNERNFLSLNIAEAEIKQAMVRSAGTTIFLADHDKIGEVASAFVTDISGADLLITDDGADATVLGNLRGDGLAIEVVRPKAT
jgi:DeoR/GlpR family transcriptional regulator of sugar metabolism